MKALTLKQPWATLVSEGIKKYEFRSWKTNYRGFILIHAGKGIDKKEMDKFKNMKLDFPSKKIIAIAKIDDCIKLDENINKKIISENNIAYSNKIREGYAWVLKDIKKVKFDKEINGKLGIWNIDLNIDDLKTIKKSI